jgi:tetratricopeptide (TPR) repeat protein
MRRWAGILSLLWSFAALAQAIVPDRELEIVRQNFNVGNYKEALIRATNAMEVSNFNEQQRAELHKYAGLSSFNLGNSAAAEKHFLSLLQLNPDYVLDPFAYPPPTIRLFEEVKRKNADTLNLIRQQIALREEQGRREGLERDRARVLAEEQRRRLEELAKQVTVKTIEKRSFLLNLLPFGLGQFQQGRNGFGVFFAALEAVSALTSMISFVVIERLFIDRTYTFEDRLYPDDGRFSVKVRVIPQELKGTAEVLRTLKYASGATFYAAWAAGSVDALWHHRDEVVSVESKRLEEVAAPISPSRDEGPRLFLFPISGGVGAGFNLRF